MLWREWRSVRLAMGQVGATLLYEKLVPLIQRLPDWLQGRELVEALPIHLALMHDEENAFRMFEVALASADAKDAYGASWLLAEFAIPLRVNEPDKIDSLVRRYGARAESSDTPRIRERFGVLTWTARK